jgi:hypothetical protein
MSLLGLLFPRLMKILQYRPQQKVYQTWTIIPIFASQPLLIL